MIGASTSRRTAAAAVLALLPAVVFADASDANFAFNQQPSQAWQDGQAGFNNCVQRWGQSNDTAMCQTAVINDASDFCLWAPPKMDIIANTERFEVAYCTKPGHGSRLIPDGTLTSVHFTKAQGYVQVIATGDFSKINIPASDGGGELDPHGADGNGNPIGGLVYTTAFGLTNGQPKQVHQWMNFMGGTQACFRACLGGSDNQQRALCQHIYDVMGCEWNMPSTKYADLSFDTCDSDNGDAPGVYGASTWYQGECGVNCAPPAHDPPATSNCKTNPSPVNNVAVAAPTTASASGTSSGPAPTGIAGASSGMASVVSAAKPTGSTVNNVAGSSSGAASLSGKSGSAVALAAGAVLAGLAAALTVF